MLKAKRIFFFIVCCFVTLVKSDTEDDGYSGEVKELFQDLKDYFRLNVERAEQKMWSFSSETMDRKYAIGLIHLYSQQSDFFKTLNKEMRSNYLTNTDIWRRSGDLINRGIDILGPTEHTIVYRGCTALDSPPEKGHTFKFNQITSTTLVREKAEVFAYNYDKCKWGMLFVISNVNGLLAEDYSYYPNEKEVLIKSNYVFKVTKEPQQTEEYTIFTLDGESESINSGKTAYAGILMQCSIVVVTILILGK